jgi:hypothetical protein
MDESNKQNVRYYFVDEAGDGTLFDRKGRVIIGNEGCSSFFILGLLDIVDPTSLERDMKALCEGLLSDPYFRSVPSMKPEARKTASAFHAKDDLPEVRRDVFSLLMQHELRFFAVVRNKRKLLEYVRQRNEVDTDYRYHPNELYDFLVRHLFRDRLHKDDAYNIHFAKRGKSDRTKALSGALEAARRRFTEKWGIAGMAPIKVVASRPRDMAGLQTTDYFLWALQRLYERREDRYIRLLWPAFCLVRDLDDTRNRRYGEYYTQERPLSLAAIEDRPGI